MNLTEFLGRQTKGILIGIGIVLLAGVAVGDLFTATEFELAIFYLVPISFFSWFIGRNIGLITAFACAGITFSVQQAAASRFAYPAIVYWNALAWLGLYIFCVLMIAELRGLYERELHFSHTDSLTKIPNRRAFMEFLAAEASRARRYGLPLTLAYLDIDRFKEINDRMGHAAGDEVLARVAQTMQEKLRRADRVARIGGDEFAVLLPETNADSAVTVLHKLHSLLDAAMRQGGWPVTFSMGAASFQPPPESIERMIRSADEAMYAAKASGRDKIIVRNSAA